MKINGAKVLTPEGWRWAGVEVADGLVVAIESGMAEPSAVESSVDATGRWVLPGFIDLQVNGGWGIDLALEPERLWELGERLLSTGVTAWLPTLISAPKSLRSRALAALSDRPMGWVGAEPLGWHLEGPWLNPDRVGAHDLRHLARPGESVDVEVSGEAGVRLVTLAPEVDGCIETVSELVKRGIIVSLGHSDASTAITRRALEAGATMGTHLFNAMSGLDHRKPGLAAALLVSDCYVGIIADGVHVAPEMVQLAWKVAGARTILVTDVMAGFGLQAGLATLGGRQVRLDGRCARLVESGHLAGSVLDMPNAIMGFSKMTGCTLIEAVRAGTTNPCRAIQDSSRGEIVVGGRADLAIVTFDEASGEMVVEATVVSGNLVEHTRRLSVVQREAK